MPVDEDPIFDDGRGMINSYSEPIASCFRSPACRLALELTPEAREPGGPVEGRADEVMDSASREETNE